MGKIHKALEKSKKEQKEKTHKDLRIFGALKKDTQKPVEVDKIVQAKNRNRVAEEIELTQIHELLYDKDGKEAPFERIREDDKRQINKQLLDAGENKSAVLNAKDIREKGPVLNKTDDESSIKPISAGAKNYIERAILTRSKRNDGIDKEELKSVAEVRSTTNLVNKKDDTNTVLPQNLANKPKGALGAKGLTPVANAAASSLAAESAGAIIRNKAPVADTAMTPGNDIYREKQPDTGPNVAKQPSDESLITLTKPKSFESEQFKLLRTNLLFPESGVVPRSILITSALPGDGKSFIATNLAISLAQGLGQHVLLVDADIRRPEIHKRFGYPMDISGLSDYLSGNKPIQSLILNTHLDKLKILPGGSRSNNPSELVSSEKMVSLLQELTSRYKDRCIIIDTPPPKLASEASALSRFVDCVLLVVRAGKTKKEVIDETIGLVGRDKIRGIIFNGYNMKSGMYSNYHKYGNYYKMS